jgi:hypothetical protein
VACESLQDATSCNATYACYWYGKLPYCEYTADSYYAGVNISNCYAGVRSPTMACQMALAENATAKACAAAITKTACNSDDSCAWGDSESECYGSSIGYSKAYKKLGSKVADQMAAQDQACTKVTSKAACLAVPLPAAVAGSTAKLTMPPPAAVAGSTATKSTSPANASMAVPASSPPSAARSGASAALPTLLLSLLSLLLALAAAL